MGGPGSGRYPALVSITDCRCLSLGELVDRGRTRRLPQGASSGEIERVAVPSDV